MDSHKSLNQTNYVGATYEIPLWGRPGNRYEKVSKSGQSYGFLKGLITQVWRGELWNDVTELQV